MELYGSLTTKDLEKKHSSRLIGGAEMGSWDKMDAQQGGSLQTRCSHICTRINWEEQLGSETDGATHSYSIGNESLKTSE